MQLHFHLQPLEICNLIIDNIINLLIHNNRAEINQIIKSVQLPAPAAETIFTSLPNAILVTL